VSVLRFAGVHATVALAPLIVCLQDEDARIRRNAAVAIGRIGPKAKSAVPGLTKLLGDSEPVVRNNALQALGRIGPSAKSAATAIAPLFEDSTELLRVRAMETLLLIDPSQKRAAIERLQAYLGTEFNDAEVRLEAVLILSRYDVAAAKAGQPLLAAAWETSENLQKVRIAVAWCRIDPTQTMRMLPIMEKMIENIEESERARIEAISALHQLAPKRLPDVTGQLVEWSKSGTDAVRLAAMETLWQISPKAAQTAGIP
jgi:HEAT repeat protein